MRVLSDLCFLRNQEIIHTRDIKQRNIAFIDLRGKKEKRQRLNSPVGAGIWKFTVATLRRF